MQPLLMHNLMRLLKAHGDTNKNENKQ